MELGADVVADEASASYAGGVLQVEIPLSGMVLPIGGLKEKALAAQRAGVNRLIVPRRNEPDIDEIPEPLRRKIKFTLVDHIDEVLDAALQKRVRRSRAGEPG